MERDNHLTESSACNAISALMRRADVLVTNRPHGLVFAIKNGLPAIAIAAVAGGDKVTAQARSIEWPICFAAEDASQEKMDAAFNWCLTDAARTAAKKSRARALEVLATIELDLTDAFDSEPTPKSAQSFRNPRSWNFFGLRSMFRA